MIFPKEGEFIFPIADGGDQDLRTSTLVRHRPIQGESNIDFLGESEGSGNYSRLLHATLLDQSSLHISFQTFCHSTVSIVQFTFVTLQLSAVCAPERLEERANTGGCREIR